MEYINMEKWDRKEHFEFFYRMDYPHYNICANIDITKFLAYVKKKQLLFYYAMIYSSTFVANQIINFRYRIRKGRVILHDIVHPSFTDIKDQKKLFKLVNVKMENDIFDFTKKAADQARKQKEYFALNDHVRRDDLIYITCLPWISFTHISHTISLNKDDSIPRISWGKYFTENNKVLLPFSVQVNHALVDGLHVGQYFSKLQDFINTK